MNTANPPPPRPVRPSAGANEPQPGATVKTLIATNGETGEDRMELWDGPRGKSILMPGGSWLHEGQIGYAEALEYCDVIEPK